MADKSKPLKVTPLDFRHMRSFSVATPKGQVQPDDCDCCWYDDNDCRPLGSKICLSGQIFVCQAGGTWHNTFEECDD
jgi:hypothetical protein